MRKRLPFFLANQTSLFFSLEETSNIHHEVTIEEVSRAIKKLKINNAPGPDGFSAIYYKKTEEVLVGPLKDTINNILVNGLPETWKDALIVLIPKNVNIKEDISKFRPISLTYVDYKIFMSILADRMRKILVNHIRED